MSPAVALLPSYVSGTSEVPLLGETIGANFDRTVAADPVREEGFPMTVTGKIRKVEMREKSTGILGLGDAAAIRNV
jgi:hypothetical protein